MSATDRVREKLTALKAEADSARELEEVAKSRIKVLEQELLQKEQEITSLASKVGRQEVDLEKADTEIQRLKALNLDGESSKQTGEGLSRKVQLLEDELDAAEKNLKEAVEKLRQVDVKAEHFERQVHRVEQERDALEAKYEKLAAEFAKTKKDLDELERSMGDL